MNLTLYYVCVDSDERPVYVDTNGRFFYDDLSKNGKVPHITMLDQEQEGDVEVIVTDKYDFVYVPHHVTKAEVEKPFIFTNDCPMCGRKTYLHFNQRERKNVQRYINREGLINEILPALSKMERELLITGYCYSCQRKIFSQEPFLLIGLPDFQCFADKEIAYNRLDHDGYRWYNTWFPKLGTNGNKNMSEEMEQFSNYMTQTMLNRGRSDIKELCEFFDIVSIGDGEYNLYCEGSHCNYWIRLIDRPKDYNMYIHCYLAEDD